MYRYYRLGFVFSCRVNVLFNLTAATIPDWLGFSVSDRGGGELITNKIQFGIGEHEAMRVIKIGRAHE